MPMRTPLARQATVNRSSTIQKRWDLSAASTSKKPSGAVSFQPDRKNEKEVAVVCCLKTKSWIIITTELSTEADDDDGEWLGWKVKSNGRSSAQLEDLAERTDALISGLIGRGYSVFEIEAPFVRRDGYQQAGAPIAWSGVVANYGDKPLRHEVDHLTGDGAFAKFAERAVKKLRTDGAMEFLELRKLRRILTEVSNAPENLQTHGINANTLKARGLYLLRVAPLHLP